MSFRTSTTLPDNLPPTPDALFTEPHSAKLVAKSDTRRYAYPRANRVTRGADIEQVRKEGKRVRTASMEVRAIASLAVFAPGVATGGVSGVASTDASQVSEPGVSTTAVARVGVVVPRYGKSAVDRNRLKRRLRELVRIEVLPVLPVLDVVIKTAPRAYSRTFDELREEVRKWTQQLVTGRGVR